MQNPIQAIRSPLTCHDSDCNIHGKKDQFWFINWYSDLGRGDFIQRKSIAKDWSILTVESLSEGWKWDINQLYFWNVVF